MFDQCMCSIADAACNFAIFHAEEDYNYWVDRWYQHFKAVMMEAPWTVIVRCGISRWGDYTLA